MKCLVTGGAGFIGTNLIKRLLKEGHDVISFDNYSTGCKENHQEGCEYVDINIKDGNSLAWIFSIYTDFDVIFHLAALARIQPSIKNPIQNIENNFNGTLNILEYARKNDIQVVYAGSSSFHCGLYGSPYAWSKYGGEELCKLYSEVYDLNTAICRFYNVYGPHQILDGAYAAVVGIFQRQYLDNQPLTIVGDGTQRRDFTHVYDIVDGLYRCMNKKFKANIFELGSGVNYSINKLADMFNDTEKTYIPARSGEYPVTLCQDRKALEKLNWKPKCNLTNYMKEWIKENVK